MAPFTSGCGSIRGRIGAIQFEVTPGPHASQYVCCLQFRAGWLCSRAACQTRTARRQVDPRHEPVQSPVDRGHVRHIKEMNTLCLCLFTAFPLPCHCLSTALPLPCHCLATAFSLPLHCLFITFHGRYDWLGAAVEVLAEDDQRSYSTPPDREPLFASAVQV